MIDTQFNITLSQFLTWNPEINSQCAYSSTKRFDTVYSWSCPGSNILAGVQYCVAGRESCASLLICGLD